MDIVPVAARIAHTLAEDTDAVAHPLDRPRQKADTLVHKADSMVADTAAVKVDNRAAGTVDNTVAGKIVPGSLYYGCLRSSCCV